MRWPKRGDSREDPNGRSLGHGLLFLTVAAYAPLRVFFANAEKFPHPERVALIIGLYAVIGLVWYSVLRCLRLGVYPSLLSSFALMTLVGSGRGLATSMSTYSAVLVVIAISLVMVLVANRLSQPITRFLTKGLVIFLLIGISATGLGEIFGSVGISNVEDVNTPLPQTLEYEPDIYVLVLDGFPGPRAVRDVYGSNLELPTVEGVVRIEAWASYPMTIASIASLFDMGYPLDGGDVLNTATSRELSRVMAGGNRFTAFLDSKGYSITHVESGYSNSYCNQIVDTCVPSAFLDEGTFEILGESLLGVELRERAGSPFTVGALHTMEWLTANMSSFAENGRKDFVFASILAPHPPLLLDQGCEFTYEYWRVGNSVFAGDRIIEERQQAFLDQAECVVGFEAQVLRSLPDDVLAIVLSDHGGDSLGQMSKYGHVWSDLDAIERLNTHLAIKSSVDCHLETPVFLSGLLQDLLWCLADSSSDAPDSIERMHTASRIRDSGLYLLDELTVNEMQELLGPRDS